MLIELLFVLGLVWALWYIWSCNQEVPDRPRRLCPISPPPNPAAPYTPLPYPKDTHNSDTLNRVYDADGTRIR